MLNGVSVERVESMTSCCRLAGLSNSREWRTSNPPINFQVNLKSNNNMRTQNRGGEKAEEEYQVRTSRYCHL